MPSDFPSAVPEIPVNSIDKATAYYVKHLGFHMDWGDEAGGIAGLSKGNCRVFLTNPPFRSMYGNAGSVVIWLNLNSKAEVDQLHEQWKASGAKMISGPEDKPWKLHEFTVGDLDGNLLRVFYDFGSGT